MMSSTFRGSIESFVHELRAAAVNVSHVCAQRVMWEIQSPDGCVDPDYTKSQRLKGPGSLSSDAFDIAVLLYLLLRRIA